MAIPVTRGVPKAIKRGGQNPFKYVGVEPITPYQFVIYNFIPTSKDFDFNIGTVWLQFDKYDPDNETVWMLINRQARVATWLLLTPTVRPGILFLTGNSGGEVGVDMNHNINTLSGFLPLTLDGNAGTFTITLNSDGTLATSYETDSGTAVPLSGVLNIVGGDGGFTSGSGNTVTIVPDISVATQYDADTGSAVPSANILNIVGSGNISTSAAGDTVTVTDNAYNPIDFVTDAGTATPSGGILNMFGGLNVTTSGSGDTVTISLDNIGGPGVVVTSSTGVLSSINGLDGQVVIAATGDDPLWAFLTSSNNSIKFTFGPNSIDLSAGGADVATAGENINITHPIQINLNETIHWESTNMAGTEGAIYLGGAGVGGTIFMHNYGSSTPGLTSTYLGIPAGNLTLNTTTAIANVAIGSENMGAVSTGGYNTSIGAQCCFLLTTGSENTGIGEQCLRAITSGIGNSIVGNGNGINLTTGNYNSSFGSLCFEDPVTGHNNLIMGCLSTGNSITTAINFCFLSTRDSVGDLSAGNEIFIGNRNSPATPSSAAYIQGIYGYAAIGGVQTYITRIPLTNYDLMTTNTSSERYKENIKPINKTIDNVEPVAFTYKSDNAKRIEFGMIAEQVEEYFPEMIVYDKDDEPFTIQYDKFVPILLKEVQDLNRELELLEAR